MKIYQLHKYGGEWEDAYNYIIGSYFRKERAEEEKTKAELKYEEDRELSRHCDNCPIVNNWNLDDEVARECEKYCDRFKYIDMGDEGFDCGNYVGLLYDSHFNIEEVEVEE